MAIRDPKTRLFKIEFIHLVRKGMTAQQIAAKLGVSTFAVRDRAKRYKLVLGLAPRGRKPFGITERDMEDLGADEPVSFASETIISNDHQE